MNPENLKPFAEGEDSRRNLAGRPPGKSIKTILDEILDLEAQGVVLDASEVKQLSAELGRKITYREALAIRMMAKALSNPESKSVERVLDRTEGKPKEQIHHTVEVENQSFKIGDQEIKF